MEFATQLEAARREKTEATIELTHREIELAKVKATAELDIIVKLGGANGLKGLGPNEAAQDRVLLHHLDTDPNYEIYQLVWARYLAAKERLLRASTELEILLDQRRDFENMLRSGE